MFFARLIERALNDMDLTLAQYRILSGIDDGWVHAVHLSEMLALTQPAISLATEGLVTRGLLERTPDPSDRRRTVLRLTRAGRAALDAANHLCEQEMEAILELGSSRERARAESGAGTLWSFALRRMAAADRANRNG